VLGWPPDRARIDIPGSVPLSQMKAAKRKDRIA